MKDQVFIFDLYSSIAIMDIVYENELNIILSITVN